MSGFVGGEPSAPRAPLEALGHTPDAARVRSYYARKTHDILQKYGPGPRVHFHTGLVGPRALAEASARAGDEAGLRQLLVESQERLLEASGQAWNGAETLSGQVLDVGCGLGGGAIFWASRFGAHVSALTNVPAHVPWIRQLTLRAGVSGRVQPTLSDACELSGPRRFDAAIAVESSCYFDRTAWFEALRTVLRPGGHVFVVDSFGRDPVETATFDEYWHCRLGTLESYRRAAAQSGFELIQDDELTEEASGFWEISRLHSLARLAFERDREARLRLSRSVEAHWRFRRAFETRAIEDRRLVFRFAG